MPQSQAATLPRHQEDEKKDKTKKAQIEQTYEKHGLALSSPSDVIAMLKDWKTQEQNNTRQDVKQIASKNKPQSNKA